MIQELEKGMYLVGREDGGIDPFFAVIETGYVCMTGDDTLVPAAQAMRDFTKGLGHWWWRRIPVPVAMPSQIFLDALPSFPVMRGGL